MAHAQPALATDDAPRRDRRLVCLAGSHLATWAGVIVWRIVDVTPATSTASGSGFVASTTGRALVLVSVIAGVVALVAVLVQTWSARRHPAAWILFAALAGALARRETIDAFDVAWFLIVPSVAAWALLGDVRRRA